MNSHPLASPAASISANVTMEFEGAVEFVFASSSLIEHTEVMMAAAWRTARLPPEMLPRTVVTTPVVVTAGENN